MTTKKFGVLILYFDCDQFILRTIENCAQHVDKIYVSYSPLPWSAYNKDAREKFPNPVNPEILKTSPHYDKIELIEGVYDTEEEQRNAVVKKANEDDLDYLIIQDADEFYLKEEYEKLLSGILENPNHDYYRTPWYFFWKDLNHVILSKHPKRNNPNKAYIPTMVSYNACTAINLKKGIHFTDKRKVNSSSFFIVDALCYHLSYVLNSEQLDRKLKTWGHSGQVDIASWYTFKWLAWTPKTKNLHPVDPHQWVAAKKVSLEMPKALDGFEIEEQQPLKLSLSQSIKHKLKDAKSIATYYVKDLKHIIRS